MAALIVARDIAGLFVLMCLAESAHRWRSRRRR